MYTDDTALSKAIYVASRATRHRTSTHRSHRRRLCPASSGAARPCPTRHHAPPLFRHVRADLRVCPNYRTTQPPNDPTTHHRISLLYLPHGRRSPDGRDIVFAFDRGGDYDLYRLTLGGAALQNLTDNLAQDASPAVAPDGTLLLFDSNREGNYELYVLDLSTLAVTRLTNNTVFDADPAWQP